jgi:hypothetical protein
VHAPLGNHLAVEVGELLEQPDVLQQGRAARAGGHGVLVVRHGGAGGGGEFLAHGYFRQLLEFSILDNIFEGTNIRQIYLSNHTNVMNFLAQIFQFTDVNILKEKFKTWHFKNEMSNKILTLIKLQSFETIDYFKAKKMLKSSNLKRIEVLAHFKNFKNIKDVMALYDYEAVYTGEILKNMGYSQGLDMGLKMAELETASFLRFSETYFPN